MYNLFSDISELLTLSGAVKKNSRQTLARDLGVIKNAQMITQGGRVLWVGKKIKLTSAVLKKLNIKSKQLKKISLNHATVMPSFVECHTHTIFSGNRQHEFELRNAGQTYQQIAAAGGGILSTVKNTRRASVENLLRLAQARIDRFIDQGVTTVEIKSGYGLDLKTELKMLNVARKIKKAQVISTYLGPHAVPKKYSSARDYMDFIINGALPVLQKKNLLDRADIFVEKGYFNLSLAKKYFTALEKLNIGFSAHIDQLTGSGAVGELCKLKNFQSVDHLVEISLSEIKALSKSNCTAVLLPVADFYLKMKYPPARTLIEQGARVALATDFNPGSAPSQDLSLVGVLARLEMKMSLPEVIVAYTLGASHALGLSGSIGSLQPQKQANFICLKDNWDQLFYSVGYHPVASVWKGGKLIKACH